jgi:signal peptidase I
VDEAVADGADDVHAGAGAAGELTDDETTRWFDELSVAGPEPIVLDWPPKTVARSRPSVLRSLVEWTLVIGGALALALLIRTFAVQTFKIPSESMQSTLLVKDRVLVNKLSYRVHDINRGDVVVFTRPPKETNTQIKDLIKRVIGLPGETVEGRDGHILIDGRLLTEPYLDPGKATSDFGPVKVPVGSIWVMGDNRDHSQDSRVFGPIEQRTVVGRAFLRIWPFGRIGWL